MSREFVDSITSGDNLDAEKAFKDSMTNKIGDALEVRRKELSKTFVSNTTGFAVGSDAKQEEEE